MVGIYKLTSPSGKCYIGQSNNIESRIHHYRINRCKSQTRIYNALLKYGFDNFQIEYLKILNNYISKEKMQEFLNRYEIYYINKYDSINNGYNIRGGGSNGRMSEESKIKISIKNTGKIFTKEHLMKLSISHIGYKMTEDQKRKISIKSKLSGISAETRAKMVASRAGYKPTAETLVSQSKSHIKKAVLQFDLNENLIRRWDCAVHAAKELNYTLSCIYYACNGRYKKYKNYV